VKLLFFIASLQCGGAERVSVTLCNYWAERGWDVTIATLDDGSEPPFFPLAAGVRHEALRLAGRRSGFVRPMLDQLARVRAVRRFVTRERPDRIVSFIDETNVLILLAARGTGVPVVVSVRTDPARHAIPRSWRFLRRLTYPWARAIVLQTETAAAYFPASWASRVAVIPNPVPKRETAKPDVGSSEGATHRIVAMGRLGKEKGFDLLIRAFAGMAPTHPGWSLTILGEGEERVALQAEIERSGVAGRVSLAGRVTDTEGFLRASELFVLPSRYEGFPNALCEAMACGLPVVAFDCRSGPATIVRDGVDGLLVPAEDVGALSAAMARLIADPEARRRMGARAAEVSDRFSVGRIASLWERVLLDGAA
jgi:GalNAc-alpha-(1->4)-GalNAc-alpha-(1->3)-diNAcBac-PP-undecaprenol alpha-1,4-N-acetyl-D-galactosaminyltransferase